MQYSLTEITFKFFNGQNRLRIEFSTALNAWYVFDDSTQSRIFLFKKEGKNTKATYKDAFVVLNEYLETL